MAAPSPPSGTRFLLDTHAWLWWSLNAPQLSPAARSAMANPANEVFCSAASAWEIATKQRLGKLPGVPQVAERWAELVALDGFMHLAIDHRHAVLAGAYTLEYRDPFDRMLAAQAQIEGMTLITVDPVFAQFGTATLW